MYLCHVVPSALIASTLSTKSTLFFSPMLGNELVSILMGMVGTRPG